LFLACVTCPVVFFCDEVFYAKWASIARASVYFVVRAFESYEMTSPSMMEVWKSFHQIDPERSLHSPELYAVWAAKQEFVNLAATICPEFSTYVWCDAGAFRRPRKGSFKHVAKHVSPEKITCLYVPEFDTIGGGILAGDKVAWLLFREEYLRQLRIKPHGKDQMVYKRFLNAATAKVIEPFPVKVDDRYDPWFHLLDLFSEDDYESRTRVISSKS
jgi:hypothetical protein